MNQQEAFERVEEALKHINYSGTSSPVIRQEARDALAALEHLRPAAGNVEALKKPLGQMPLGPSFGDWSQKKGWNACIDHLAATGRLLKPGMLAVYPEDLELSMDPRRQ